MSMSTRSIKRVPASSGADQPFFGGGANLFCIKGDGFVDIQVLLPY
jgi:hypothetical protein